MDESNIPKVEERRRFFRIDDEVNLVYKKIDEKIATEASYISDHILGNCSLSAALDMVSHESSLLLNRLERSQPEVADYLRLLDNKIDLLAQALLMQSNQFTEQTTRNANLSAAGLAFESEEALEPGEYLEIKMTLLSCMAVIVTYGKVVYCKQNTANDSKFPYVAGVDYINMKDQDRELLIKHIVRRLLPRVQVA